MRCECLGLPYCCWVLNSAVFRFDGILPATPTRAMPGTMKRKQLAHETPLAKTSRMGDYPPSPAGAVTTPANNLFKDTTTNAPLEAFKQRSNAGESVWCINENIPKPNLPISGASYETRAPFRFNMDANLFRYRTMYQKLSEASEAHDELIDALSDAIQVHYKLPNDAFGDPAIGSPSEIVAVGRIVSDSLEGKFNPSSILLETSRMVGAGARTPLKLDNLASFSFFPGQIVAVRGVNSSGKYFQVHEVLEPPMRAPASSSSEELVETAERLATGPLT